MEVVLTWKCWEILSVKGFRRSAIDNWFRLTFLLVLGSGDALGGVTFCNVRAAFYSAYFWMPVSQLPNPVSNTESVSHKR